LPTPYVNNKHPKKVGVVNGVSIYEPKHLKKLLKKLKYESKCNIHINFANSFPKNKKMQEKGYIVTSNNQKKVLDCRKRQNKKYIYVFPFKTMEIMKSCCLFIHMNVNEFKPKIHWIKF